MGRVPYASVISILIYVMLCNRPDIAHAVEVLRKYMLTLGKEHWTIVKRVFKYVAQNIMLYATKGNLELIMK